MKRHTYTIRFECKKAKVGKDGKAPIYAVITIDGKPSLIQLQKKSKPEEFKRLMNARTTNSVKSYLEGVKYKLDEIHTSLSRDEDAVTSARIKDIYLNGFAKSSYTLSELINNFRDQKIEEKVNLTTWGKYKRSFDDFIDVTGHSLTDEVKSVTHADILLFEARMMADFADMTVKKKLKNVKALFAFAVAEGKIQVNPFLNKKIGAGEADTPTEYLTYEEIQKVKNLDLRSDRLCRARDMFLWQCFTGQNIGDMAIMKKDDVRYNAQFDVYYIEKPRKKTGKFGREAKYTSILFEDAIDIWKTYNGILPYIQGQHYNENLKDIMDMAGIHKTITSRSGRTTYACYLFNTKNIRDWALLGQMLGHSNERQTREYCKIFDDTLFRTVSGKPAITPNKTPDRIKGFFSEGLKITY